MSVKEKEKLGLMSVAMDEREFMEIAMYSMWTLRGQKTPGLAPIIIMVLIRMQTARVLLPIKPMARWNGKVLMVLTPNGQPGKIRRKMNRMFGNRFILSKMKTAVAVAAEAAVVLVVAIGKFLRKLSPPLLKLKRLWR